MKRAWAIALLLIASVAATLEVRADDEEAKVPSATVVTAEGERASGVIAAVADGKLTLASDPPRSFELADLERIALGQSAAPPAATSQALIWIGQDNHDLVQVGGATGGNGIQDIHLRATDLAAKPITQIVVVCRFPKLLRVWRLDTSRSPHWRLAIVRSDVAPRADFYIEPPADDSMGMQFDVSVTYKDGANSKLSVNAATHTSDQLKVDKSAQPGVTTTASPATKSPAGTAEIHLLDQGRLLGTIGALDPESLALATSWGAEVDVPILHVKGVWFGAAAPSGAREKFDKQLKAPQSEDVVFVTARDNTDAQVAGAVQSLNDEELVLRFDGEDRSIKRERLLGVVFAAHPMIPPSADTYQTFVLAGQSFSGKWIGLSDGSLNIELPWQAAWQVPAESISEIRVRNGRLAYLADLEPIEVEETPYFGRVITWGPDRGFDDRPPTMQGEKPYRALAVHSRCVLTYALDGQFEKFKAVVGFDDSSQKQGRVLCRVAADGRELFAEHDLRADAKPVPIEVDVSGAKQLTLEVDFGENADIGDRVLWAEPRLFRATVE